MSDALKFIQMRLDSRKLCKNELICIGNCLKLFFK